MGLFSYKYLNLIRKILKALIIFLMNMKMNKANEWEQIKIGAGIMLGTIKVDIVQYADQITSRCLQ